MARKTHSSPEQARNAILDAAEQLVVDVGPAGMRINAVAQAAGMAHPNIIHHFGSRDGLLEALAERASNIITERVTRAINAAENAPETDRVTAVTRILASSFAGSEGKIAVWMQLSGAHSSVKQNIQQIVDATHQLRESIDGEVQYNNTNRLVLLMTLALIGEVVAGAALKQFLGFDETAEPDKTFSHWLAKLALKLSDELLD